MTSLPAERPARCRRPGQRGRKHRRVHTEHRTTGNFAEETHSHNAAPPADPPADVTVQTQGGSGGHHHLSPVASHCRGCLERGGGRGGHVLANRGGGPEMVTDTGPGDGAEKQGLTGQGQAWHQRCVHHHPAGEGEILDRRGGEDHGARVEGGVLV